MMNRPQKIQDYIDSTTEIEDFANRVALSRGTNVITKEVNTLLNNQHPKTPSDLEQYINEIHDTSMAVDWFSGYMPDIHLMIIEEWIESMPEFTTEKHLGCNGSETIVRSRETGEIVYLLSYWDCDTAIHDGGEMDWEERIAEYND
ncbi:hypothetical protein [Gimesia maris]|uniref:hypothetical protein n=1 Tax=Gimesia maris TaxID=122 RepID=UPI003A902172